jgi:hypothetical protein
MERNGGTGGSRSLGTLAGVRGAQPGTRGGGRRSKVVLGSRARPSLESAQESNCWVGSWATVNLGERKGKYLFFFLKGRSGVRREMETPPEWEHTSARDKELPPSEKN